MVCQDGFITSHAVEGIEIFDDRLVEDYIGEYKPAHPLLDVDNPVTYGPLDLQDYYFEHKRQESEAMKGALKKIPEILKEFNKTFSRDYDFIESYKIDDAELVIVVLSSTAGTTKFVVDELRDKGLKAGLLKPRFFRPFPKDKIADALKSSKCVAVLDRSETFSGEGGPLYTEIKAGLYDFGMNQKIVNYIFGLGGRDIYPEDIKKVYDDLANILENGKIKNRINYIGSRE
jgi:pyruvate ferredoxin oxidoreductase alpha subunit